MKNSIIDYKLDSPTKNLDNLNKICHKINQILDDMEVKKRNKKNEKNTTYNTESTRDKERDKY